MSILLVVERIAAVDMVDIVDATDGKGILW